MKKNAGLGLLEIIISMLILALIVASINFTLIVATKNATRNRNRVVAVSYALSTLEWLRNYVTANTAATKYQHPQYSGTYALSQRAAPGFNTPFSLDYESTYRPPLSDLGGTRDYTVTDIDLNSDGNPDLKKVTVTVNWTEP